MGCGGGGVGVGNSSIRGNKMNTLMGQQPSYIKSFCISMNGQLSTCHLGQMSSDFSDDVLQVFANADDGASTAAVVAFRAYFLVLYSPS